VIGAAFSARTKSFSSPDENNAFRPWRSFLGIILRRTSTFSLVVSIRTVVFPFANHQSISDQSSEVVARIFAFPSMAFFECVWLGFFLQGFPASLFCQPTRDFSRIGRFELVAY